MTRLRSSLSLVAASLIAIAATALITTAAASAAPAPPPPVSCAGCWHPPLQTSWNWVPFRRPACAIPSSVDV
jgi:hypothetical protein